MSLVPVTVFPPAAKIDPQLESRVKRGREHTTVTVSARKVKVGPQRVELEGLTVAGRVMPKSATSYKVRLPNADFERLNARKLAVPNPYRPETIPPGARVLLGATVLERLAAGT